MEPYVQGCGAPTCDTQIGAGVCIWQASSPPDGLGQTGPSQTFPSRRQLPWSPPASGSPPRRQGSRINHCSCVGPETLLCFLWLAFLGPPRRLALEGHHAVVWFSAYGFETSD